MEVRKEPCKWLILLHQKSGDRTETNVAPVTAVPGDLGCPTVQVNTGPFSRRKDPGLRITEPTDDFIKMAQALRRIL